MTETTKLEPVKGYCGAFLDWVHAAVCQRYDKKYEMLLDWLARAIQEPKKRDPLGLFLVGDEDTREHRFHNVLGDLFAGRALQAPTDDEAKAEDEEAWDVLFMDVELCFNEVIDGIYDEFESWASDDQAKPPRVIGLCNYACLPTPNGFLRLKDREFWIESEGNVPVCHHNEFVFENDEEYKRTLQAFMYELHARELKSVAA